MYITFNFRCADCDMIESRMVQRSDVDTQICNKPSTTFPCRGHMSRLLAAPRTHFHFNDANRKP